MARCFLSREQIEGMSEASLRRTGSRGFGSLPKMGKANGDPQARESQRRAIGKRLVLTRKYLGVEYRPKTASNEYSERDNHRKALTGGRYRE